MTERLEQVAPPAPRFRLKHAVWRATAWNQAVMLVVVSAVAYGKVWLDLWPLWNNKNATYTHGLLIAAVATWLVWRTRDGLRDVVAMPEARALPLVVLLSAGWLFAARANLLVVHTFIWPVLALTTIWAGTGARVVRRFIFPIAFLYFAIPFWDYLEPALQALASHMVGFLIETAGTQASVNGPYILLPEATIYIALTCSGAHFLAVALAMGALAGEIRNDTRRTRLLILAIAACLSVAFNSIRILMIVLAHLNPALREGFQAIGHITFGWWVFALDLLVFFFVLRLVPTSKAATNAHSPPAEPGPLPDVRHWYRGTTYALIAALTLPLASSATRMLDSYPPLPEFEGNLRGMHGTLAPDTRWLPDFEGAAWEHRAAYLADHGRVIELYANEFRHQTQDRELIAHGRVLFTEPSFSIDSTQESGLKSSSNAFIDVVRVHLRDPANRSWVGIYTYFVDGRSFTNPRDAQLATARRALLRRPVAGIIAAATPCLSDCALAESLLDRLFGSAIDVYDQRGKPP